MAFGNVGTAHRPREYESCTSPCRRCFANAIADQDKTSRIGGRHIFREINKKADALANMHSYSRRLETEKKYKFYRLFFDGSVTKTAAGGGWILYGADTVVNDDTTEWTIKAAVSFPMGIEATITICEMEACLWGITFMAAYLESSVSARSNMMSWKPLSVKKCLVLQLAQLLQ